MRRCRVRVVGTFFTLYMMQERITISWNGSYNTTCLRYALNFQTAYVILTV
jgi:hypothetical protein